MNTMPTQPSVTIRAAAYGRLSDGNTLIAHIDPFGVKREELLREHLVLTEAFAARFGSAFNADNLARLLARAHDFGKGSSAFQQYIRAASGDCEETEADANPSGRPQRGPDHSSAGAQFLANTLPGIGCLLAYAAAGHHAGLPNGMDASDAALASRLRKRVAEWESDVRAHLSEEWFECNLALIADEVRPFLADGYSCAFLVRMLFSCLVDADYLATEQFMNQDLARVRQSESALLADLESRLESFYEQLGQKVRQNSLQNSSVNVIREGVRQDCLCAARKGPGLFTLTVPTGGGKTLSSMAFALRHAVRHGLSRVVYVIPYTSIIEQTASVFREVFGKDAVLEHHCNVEWGEGHSCLKLLSENWDAPVVVTTSVQFFESLHANRPSRCRKLHNLANAVIILDEAQTIPVELLRPCLRVLDELVVRYGSTVVLCTATQPAISRERLKNWGLHGNDYGIREIVSPDSNLHQRLKRVSVERLPGKLVDDDLIERMNSFESFLTIVSTRRHARELYQRLVTHHTRETVFHLSAQMCPEHRKTVLSTTRARLQADLPCRVVATQLIEAGVDIDFPCVFREQAGCDAVAQAAGRCNREGRLPVPGCVYVFESAEHAPPRGFLRTAAQKGREIMSLPDYAEDLLAPEAITHYFQSLYHNQETAMDKFEVLSRLIPADTPRAPDEFFLFCFKELGQKFKMIDEHAVSVFIPYKDEGKRLCEELRKAFVPLEQKAIAQKLQRYAVSIYGDEPRDKNGDRIAELVHDCFWILTAPELNYSDACGVTFEGIDTFLGI